MAEPRDDDREAVDRAFAELVAGYHLTADRPDPLPQVRVDPDPIIEVADSSWADEHPLFTFEPKSAQTPAQPSVEPEREVEDRFIPEPPPPLPRPALPVLLAWIGIGYAALVVLVASFGAPIPSWAGWLALAGFVGGFGTLVARLPRTRPPDAGDGAVL